MSAELSGPLLSWWLLLCAATALNAVGWVVAARLHFRSPAGVEPEAYAVRRRLLWLAAVYVLGCGFRSILPMVDVPRIGLHDGLLSRIVIGRSVATVAELCFAAQWALLLHEAGRAIASPVATTGSWVLLVLIVVAELFSWTAVLTTNNLLHAAENSLWTLAAIMALAIFLALRTRLDATGRRFVATVVLAGGCYVAFMSVVDVPMYVSRWQADLAAGKTLLTIGDGWREITQRVSVARDWHAWREDVAWLTLYFTLAVWISIALAHAPPLRPASESRTRLMGASN